MNMFEAQMILLADSIPPDPWRESYGLNLPLDHVISRSADGRPLSVVGDFVWDWTVYHPRGVETKAYFFYWRRSSRKVNASELCPERIARIREMQHLITRLLFSKQSQGPINVTTINKAWLSGLYFIAQFAESRSCSLQDILVNRDLLDEFIDSIPDSACSRISRWLSFLWRPDIRGENGYQVAKPRRWSELLKRVRKHKDASKQFAPLPTRIYGSLMNALTDELDDIELHSEQLLSALRASIIKQKTLKGSRANIGADIMLHYGLEEYFAARGFNNRLQGLLAAVSEVFRVCKLVIHVFSGMRDAEVRHLPFHCMVTDRRDHGRKHSLILGHTTKLEGGRQREAKWITTEKEGFRAIKIAQRFSSVIYGCMGITPSDNVELRDKYPLFISTDYLSWTGKRPDNKDGYLVSRCGLERRLTTLRTRLLPVIEEADIAELEEIDPFRAWRAESEYAIGKIWPLTTHQLRRSLALYANASGLVKLSSLRRQLQHITREMSLYYARGSAFAINFLAEDPKGYKDHIIAEWQDGLTEAKYLAFVNDVFKSEEPMFGPAGIFYENKKRRGEILSREDFEKQVKKGRLAYNESPFGGCTNPSACKSVKGLRLFEITCVTEGCKYLIGKHSKIIQTIRLQRSVLTRLDVTSVTYQIEKEELDALVAAERSWRSTHDLECREE